MNTKPRTSRRNRKFGPSPGVIEVLSKETEDKETEDEETESSDSNEISELQKWGILPHDFPSLDRDIQRFDDGQDDTTEELNTLLEIGAISITENNNAQALEIGDRVFPEFMCNDHEIPDFDEFGLPSNWTRNIDSDEVYNLVKLRRGHHEFDVIEKEFRNAHIQVKKIERLQNKRLLDRFKSEAEDLERNRNDFRLNVSYLYHGSNVKKETLCEEGLDQRLSRMGYFGRGIYFSDNPLKCVHYSEDCKQEGPYEAYILKCRVLLGDMKVYPKGESDASLKREPEKETASHGSKYYDSVLGCPKDFNEFVVYDNRRTMIEYIITFQADDSVIRRLRQLSRAQTKESSHTAGFQTETTNTEIQNTNCTRYLPSVNFVDGRETESNELAPELDQTEFAMADDHFSRISDVREAVRKKRLGETYKPPSDDQREKDKELWTKLQALQGVKCEQEKLYEEAERHPSEASIDAGQRPLIVFDEMPDSYHTDDIFGFPASEDPAVIQESDWLSSQHSNYSRDEDNAVEQVLSMCVAQFLSVTGLEDSSIAKHYVQKAESDVNRAISLYYEDFA